MTRIRRRLPSSRSPRRRTYTSAPSKPVIRFKWRWFIFLLLMIPLGYYISKIDVQVREQFEGNLWSLPAEVFARPLELYSGMRLEPGVLEEELNALGYRKVNEVRDIKQYKRRGDVFYIITKPFQFWDDSEPSRRLEVHFQNDQVSYMGEYMGEVEPTRKLALVRIEPRSIGKIHPIHHEDRIIIEKLEEVPPLLINTLLAVEDQNFFGHFGISIRGLVRAAVKNFEAGEWEQGGSTITQQLVKNLYLSPERTLDRKIKEAIMAILLEWHYDKETILKAYLNEVYLGQDGDRAIHGMGMAAEFYFDRTVKELKLQDIALLVGMIRAASKYNPRKYPDRALALRNNVLKTMVKENVITPTDALIASATPLGVVNQNTENTSVCPAFLGLVQSQLRQDYREDDLRSEGLKIFTTLDPFVQALADDSMITGLKKLEQSHRGARKLEGAMVVTRSDTGEVLAMANGKNPHYAGFNRPLNAQRQIGSLIKVAVYLTALEKTDTYSLTTPLDDSPFAWRISRTETWQPQNYDFRSHGRIPLIHALANSYNLATVRLGKRLGLDKIRETMRRMGVEREFTVLPSLLLGSVSLTPVEVAQMYQTVANGGFRTPLRAIREVLTKDGDPLQRYPLSMEQRFDPVAVFLLNYAMQQVVRKGTGRKLGQLFPADMMVAGKTGTSNDLKDSWFAGFTSKMLAVTWVGRDDNLPMGLSGGAGAMYVWTQFMRAVRPESSPLPVPPQIQWRTADFGSGETIRIPFVNNRTVNARAYLNTE